MTEKLAAAQAGQIRMFRKIVRDVRRVFDKEEYEASLRMRGGFVESNPAVERLSALCGPIRRMYLPSDPVNWTKMCDILLASPDSDVSKHANEVRDSFDVIDSELNSTSILNETRVTHGEMFAAWLDAGLFQGFGDRGKKFEQMIEDFGRSVEGIAWFLTERFAEHAIKLDVVAAEALNEPVEVVKKE